MRLKVWINKRFVEAERAKVSVMDRGFLYGDGLFETMRSYAGVVFKINEHLARLFAASKIIKLNIPYNKKDLKDAVYKSIEVNRLKSAYVRLTVTRGEERLGINSGHPSLPNIIIVTSGFEGYENWMYKRGLSAKIVEIRQNEYSPVSRIKSLNFLNYILARSNARAEGYDEAILANTAGYISEGATSNVFLVKRGIITTPSLNSGIIPGITRGVILQIAKKVRLKIMEKFVTSSELSNADELFLTNSMAEILPVTSIGSRKIGNGKPGAITKFLHISYQKEVIRQVLR